MFGCYTIKKGARVACAVRTDVRLNYARREPKLDQSRFEISNLSDEMKHCCPFAKAIKDAYSEYAMYAYMHDLDLSLAAGDC